MTDIQTRYAERNVPRYTSYPTAPHFNAGVTGTRYAGWLQTLPETDLSLYLHVPFCREICHYCGCHTKASRKDAPIEAYARTLVAEIKLIGAALNATGGRSRPVTHIHWGGGTPSLLPRDSFLAVMQALREAFDIAPECEHAIELDPRYVTRDLAATLASIGVNRASLGVQDFDPGVQRAIGRIQPLEIVSAAVAALRGVGIDAINFDLMYGLPGQTRDAITATARQTLELAPTRVALFGYAHVPWMKKNQRLIDEAALPDASGRRALADAARAVLLDGGFEAIGLDHFARPEDAMAQAHRSGTLKRNFQGYTCDTAESIIGLGVSSIGRLPQGYVQNAPDVSSWHRMVEDGIAPVARGIALDDDDRARAAIIEAVMTDYSADFAAIGARYGFAKQHFDDAVERLREMQDDGLVTLSDEGQLEVTPAGRAYVRVVAAAFDAYLEENRARHSVAV
ncbi:oxygen-independent coproporphyrinogen III oxidase [Breoghania sp. L-A4]|uniref:oxygen-independent coproporphyrinogen III oxidase n=1 Tax=Breoghania sp. L-A4 TaxID=2304600 RepID=UPI000E35B98F|nr:oxygen-independent coproporphyrinogen III oxidase [Breoghania sp. L-A4]AXS42471.1 oxygen-independent coproporphyrinogen III oxidase [Breoghania sp. L-A4]